MSDRRGAWLTATAGRGLWQPKSRAGLKFRCRTGLLSLDASTTITAVPQGFSLKKKSCDITPASELVWTQPYSSRHYARPNCNAAGCAHSKCENLTRFSYLQNRVRLPPRQLSVQWKCSKTSNIGYYFLLSPIPDFGACGCSFINDTYVHASTREKKSVMDFGRARERGVVQLTALL